MCNKPDYLLQTWLLLLYKLVTPVEEKKRRGSVKWSSFRKPAARKMTAGFLWIGNDMYDTRCEFGDETEDQPEKIEESDEPKIELDDVTIAKVEDAEGPKQSQIIFFGEVLEHPADTCIEDETTVAETKEKEELEQGKK